MSYILISCFTSSSSKFWFCVSLNLRQFRAKIRKRKFCCQSSVHKLIADFSWLRVSCVHKDEWGERSETWITNCSLNCSFEIRRALKNKVLPINCFFMIGADCFLWLVLICTVECMILLQWYRGMGMGIRTCKNAKICQIETVLKNTVTHEFGPPILWEEKVKGKKSCDAIHLSRVAGAAHF